MKTYTFDFSVDAWIRDLEIEADSREEAEEKLKQMSLYDLVSDGYVKDFELSEIDCDLTDPGEEEVVVKAYNIEYDYDYAAEENLPSELELTVSIPGQFYDDLESAAEVKDIIKDEIELQTDTPVTSFDYEIIK